MVVSVVDAVKEMGEDGGVIIIGGGVDIIGRGSGRIREGEGVLCGVSQRKKEGLFCVALSRTSPEFLW